MAKLKKNIQNNIFAAMHNNNNNKIRLKNLRMRPLNVYGF